MARQQESALKALTVKQPWADAIAHLTKRVENRTWKTGYRGLLLIHAGTAFDTHARVYCDLPDTRSAVVAIARLADCHFSDDGQCCGRWAEERVYHWTLDDVQPLAEPVPCHPGRLGLWTPPQDVVTAVLAQRQETPGGAR